MSRKKDEQKAFEKAVIQESIRWINTPEPKSISEERFKNLNRSLEDYKYGKSHSKVTKFANEIIYEATMKVNKFHLKEARKGRPWVKGW